MRWRTSLGIVGVPFVLALQSAACVGDNPADNPNRADAAAADAANDGGSSDTGSGDGGGTDAAVRPTVVEVGAGRGSSCALLTDGSVWCFGTNARGGLGVTPPAVSSSPPARVAGLPAASHLALGEQSACIIAKTDSSVWCWGNNATAQLGHDPAGDLACESNERCSPTPKIVSGVVATQISAGQLATCAVTTTGGVLCWGADSDAVLRGSSPSPISPTFVPIAVTGLPSTVTEVSLSNSTGTACVVDGTKKVWCWGNNNAGQAGHVPGTNDDVSCGANGECSPVPHKVLLAGGAELDAVAHVSAERTSCATRLDGTVWCWGFNNLGQLGNGSKDENPHPEPTQVPGVAGVNAVASGETACAAGPSGMWCWGSGRGRMIGAATTPCTTFANVAAMCQLSPVKIYATAAVHVDIGLVEALLVTPAGGALGWGSNTNARLGHPIGSAGDDGNSLNPTPTPVLGLP